MQPSDARHQIIYATIYRSTNNANDGCLQIYSQHHELSLEDDAVLSLWTYLSRLFLSVFVCVCLCLSVFVCFCLFLTKMLLLSHHRKFDPGRISEPKDIVLAFKHRRHASGNTDGICSLRHVCKLSRRRLCAGPCLSPEAELLPCCFSLDVEEGWVKTGVAALREKCWGPGKSLQGRRTFSTSATGARTHGWQCCRRIRCCNSTRWCTTQD